MTTTHDIRMERTQLAEPLPDTGTSASAISWGAVFAGAVAAAALSLILLVLGVGLGFSSVSPWANSGASAKTLGISTVLWLTFVQIAASGAGGYIAGRARARWHRTHGDEVYFRDTVHGFLAWAVATLVTASVLTSAVGSIIGAGANAVGSVAGAAGTVATTGAAAAAGMAAKGDTSSGGQSGPMGYFVDSLFRKSTPDAGGTATTGTTGAAEASTSASSTAEATRIFTQSLGAGTMSPDDSRYLGQLVAQRTGLSADEATKRVNDTFAKTKAALDDAQNKAREAADQARKASAYASLWLFVTLLIGAFVASFAATFGGRRRELV